MYNICLSHVYNPPVPAFLLRSHFFQKKQPLLLLIFWKPPTTTVGDSLTY